MSWNWIIVGAGSAGCVLAARLSEWPDSSVILLEGGPDYPSVGALPPEIRSGLGPAFTHDWRYESEPGRLGRSVPLPRARLVGGCSATNAAIALRARPADFAHWVSTERARWSFDEVLPDFRDLEADADVIDDWHGRSGPVPIHRYALAEMLPEHRAFHEAAVRRGDPDAVVDETGTVIGVDALYVVDASIMPDVPSVNTNLTTLMLAERCGNWLAGRAGR